MRRRQERLLGNLGNFLRAEKQADVSFSCLCLVIDNEFLCALDNIGFLGDLRNVSQLQFAVISFRTIKVEFEKIELETASSTDARVIVVKV